MKDEPASSSDEIDILKDNAVTEVDPQEMCYSQPTASQFFKDGRTVKTHIEELKRAHAAASSAGHDNSHEAACADLDHDYGNAEAEQAAPPAEPPAKKHCTTKTST